MLSGPCRHPFRFGTGHGWRSSTLWWVRKSPRSS